MNYTDEDIRAYVKSDKSLDGEDYVALCNNEKTFLETNNFFDSSDVNIRNIVMALFSDYLSNGSYAYIPEAFNNGKKGQEQIYCFFYKIKDGLYLNFKNKGNNHFFLEIWNNRSGKPEIIELNSLAIENQHNNLCFFHTVEFFMAALDIIKKEGDINKEKIEQYIIEPFKKNKEALIKQYKDNESRIRLYTLALLKVSIELERNIYGEIDGKGAAKDVRDKSYLKLFFPSPIYEKFKKIKKLNDLRVYLINRIRENSPLLGAIKKQLNVEKLEQKMTENEIIETIKLDDLIQLYKYIRDESYGSCTIFLNTYREFFKDEQSLPERQRDFLDYIKKNKNTIEQKIYKKIKELTNYPAITLEEKQLIKKLISTEQTYLSGQTEKQSPPAKKERPHVTFSFPPEYVNMKKKYHTPPSAPQPNKQEHKGEILHINQQQKTHKNPTIDKQARVSDELNNTPPIKSKQEENNNFKSVVERYKKLLEQYRLQRKQGYGNNYEPSDMKPQVQEQWNNERKKQSIKTIITETVKEIRKNPNNKNINDTIKYLRNMVIVNILYISLSKEKSENIIKKYSNGNYPEQLKPTLLTLGYILVENKQTYIENIINTFRTAKPTNQNIYILEGFINLYKTTDPKNQDNIKRLYGILSFIKRLRTIEKQGRIHTELDDAEVNVFKKKTSYPIPIKA